MDKPIETIEQYLKRVKSIVEKAESEHSVVLFRGEAQVYDTPCQPNIFRSHEFERNPFFEKNLIEEMTANHLTNGQTYLEKAIDAQHGGFPSRLLDVSYNCLAALYFAVTPYYTKSEKEYDGKDGMVYCFVLENMYCPSGEYINDAYNACITHGKAWFDRQELFQKNHKLIDHIKKNPRIIAQQGAFILFQGNCLSSFPAHRYEKITIDGNSKESLRKELRLYFGIHTGSIYPEEFNLVDEMVRKSQRLTTKPFTFENEMELVFQNIEHLVCHYVEKLEQPTGKKIKDIEKERVQIVQKVEQELMDYKMKFIAFLKDAESKDHTQEDRNFEKAAQDYVRRYNRIIERFAEDAADAMLDDDGTTPIEICKSQLLIQV